MEIEVFEILERRSMEQHHDEQHLRQGQFAFAPPPAFPYQPVPFPILINTAEIIKTTEQSYDRQGHEGFSGSV